MAGPRTWTVPFNVDSFNAAFAALDGDAEVAAFARGFYRGVNSGRIKEGSSEAMIAGFELGQACRTRAEEFRAKQQKGGEISAANRAAKYGTAQPPRLGSDESSGPARSDLEGTSKPSSSQPVPSTLNLNQQREERTDGPEAAPPLPPVRPARASKKARVRTTHLKPESVEAFEAIWEAPPKTVIRYDQNERRDVEERVAKGSRLEAEANFQAIVDAGHATARELYAAFWCYLHRGENTKRGYIQHVSTFFGPRKGTWLEWLDAGREAIRKQDGEAS